jgi:hypothetical protein
MHTHTTAFLVMMGYWLLHSLIDWNDVEGMRDQHKDALRNHVMRDGPIDLVSIGLPNDENGSFHKAPHKRTAPLANTTALSPCAPEGKILDKHAMLLSVLQLAACSDGHPAPSLLANQGHASMTGEHTR